MQLSDNDIFIRLPSELSCSILTEWLQLHELVDLDTSHCNRFKRNVLLETVFGSSEFVLSKVPYFSLTKDFTRWIQLRGVRVNELILTKDVDITNCETYLRKFGQYVKRIELEELDSLEVGSSEATCMIALYCRSLTSLACYKCFISDSILDVLFYCSALRELYLVGCEVLWSSYVYLDNLSGLQYSRLHSVVLHCVESKWLSEAILMVNIPASLVRLSLQCDEYSVVFRLKQVLAQCVALRSLSLARSQVLSDAFALELVALCSALLHLDLSACMDLTDITGIAVARSLLQLRTFNMSFCTFSDAVLQELSMHRGELLEGVYINSCSNISGEGVNHLLQSCPKLHTFSFSGCDIYAPDINMALLGRVTTLLVEEATLEDEILEGLVQHCKNLQHLRVSFEEGYETFDFAQFNVQNMPYLHTLVVVNPWEGMSHNSAQLTALRALRPTLTITHNTMLQYNLLSLPL